MSDPQSKSKVAVRSKFELSEVEKNRLVKQYEGCPTSSGRTQYLRYLHGERLTYMETVLAKCAECNCGYMDGRYDCGIPSCPLYRFMPYRDQVDEEIGGGDLRYE